VIQVFRYVKSKDVFEEFYARSLCRRLLLKKSASYDAERSMITKLKTECGDLFTAKVEGMMKDLNISNQFMQEYKMVRGGTQPQESDIETHFYVLSKASWPVSTQEQKVQIPPYLADLQSDFEKCYVSRHKGTCIAWSV
jgi:cullin 4